MAGRTKYLLEVVVVLFIMQIGDTRFACNGASVEEELTLTYQEKMALDEFKKQVADFMPHDYMKEDIYLIKWLRLRNLDMSGAKKMLMNNLRWREENGLDGILEEDFSFFLKRFPFWLDGRDKEGRPVGTADISTWDPRSMMIAGKGPQLHRYVISVVEMGARMIREDQKNGRNVTQVTLIANMDGFNLVQHGCLQCVPYYIRFLHLYENYYPGLLHKFFIVNTPPTFETLLRIARPIVSKETRESWSIHGINKNVWQAEVLKAVDADQIRPQFGGTKKVEAEPDTN